MPPLDLVDLSSFGENIVAVVIGATGGIGKALIDQLVKSKNVKVLYSFSRRKPINNNPNVLWQGIDIEDEESIRAAAETVSRDNHSINVLIVATGFLHEKNSFYPEKTWRSLTRESFTKAFSINTIGPAIVGKHFLPLLAKVPKTVFAALSARVGSIEDNRTGGWHAYRASKTALNMIIKNFSIELKQKKPDSICIGLHPGTVNTPLSKPFHKNITPEKLFTPTQSAKYLLEALNKLTPEDSGSVIAWDGRNITA